MYDALRKEYENVKRSAPPSSQNKQAVIQRPNPYTFGPSLSTRHQLSSEPNYPTFLCLSDLLMDRWWRRMQISEVCFCCWLLCNFAMKKLLSRCPVLCWQAFLHRHQPMLLTCGLHGKKHNQVHLTCQLYLNVNCAVERKPRQIISLSLDLQTLRSAQPALPSIQTLSAISCALLSWNVGRQLVKEVCRPRSLKSWRHSREWNAQ